MKYNDKNKPIVCMMTQSTCYKGTSKLSAIRGILWHSTGANNPTLKRYVQPDDNASNKQELLDIIGVNAYKNDFNHINRQAGLNAWIGELEDGTIATIQTMPWNYKPWGCGSGSRGSCNNGWIQFEICEDSLNNKEYFEAVYKEACELTAYLCKMYNLDPKGSVKFAGIEVPVILCHADSNALKLGSAHGDVLHWFKKYNKTMDDVRNDVYDILKENAKAEEKPKKVIYRIRTSWDKAASQKGAYSNLDSAKLECNKAGPGYHVFDEAGKIIYSCPVPIANTDVNREYKVGDRVYITTGAVYTTGKVIPEFVLKNPVYIRKVCGDGKYGFSINNTGSLTGITWNKYFIPYEAKEDPQPVKFEPYLIRVMVDELEIHAGAGPEYKVTKKIKRNGIYTIVAEKGNWGKLKSGAGWINLASVAKIEVKI